MRKKTKEELKLLEYFMEQDPKWTKKTVSTAAKVLGLTSYQVYKWGYDRKNKKESKCAPLFLKELEITNSMIDKINKFDNEIKGDSDIDLNKLVEDLFISNGKYKLSGSSWTEIPIGELSLHKDSSSSTWIEVDHDYSFFDDQNSTTNGPFKITKVPRQRWSSKKVTLKNSTRFSKNWDFQSFSQWTEYQKYKIQKTWEKDMMERYSDSTNERSSSSFLLEEEACNLTTVHADNSSFSR